MRIYYDEEGDYLTIFIGDSRPNYGEDIAGYYLFKNRDTSGRLFIGHLSRE